MKVYCIAREGKRNSIKCFPQVIDFKLFFYDKNDTAENNFFMMHASNIM